MGKKRNNKKIPREERVSCIVKPDETGSVEIKFDSFGDLYSMSNMEPNSVFHSRSYKGLNRERQLSLVGGGNKLSFDQDRFIFENYDRVYFIDTNDSIFNGFKSSCTAVFELKDHKKSLLNTTVDRKVYIEFFIGFYQLEVLDCVSGEKIGWHLFLESTRKFFDSFPDGAKVLLVTDHALDEHKEINGRKVPYYLNFYLPRCVEIGYAKSDKSDSFLELAMKNTDKKSNELKNQFKENEGKQLIIKTLNYDKNFRGYITILSKK